MSATGRPRGPSDGYGAAPTPTPERRRTGVTRLTIALFNYENGGFRSGVLGGDYDFRPLQYAVAQAEVVPGATSTARSSS